MSDGKFERILAPGTIGPLRLKNRIIFNPCETLHQTLDGEVTQKLIDFYVRRAQGGASLLVVHSAQACTKLDPFDPFAHSLRVDDNAYIPMLGELTEAVHRAGAKIAILVSPGPGAQSMGSPYDRGLEGVVDPQNVGASEEQSLVAQRRVRKLSTDEVRKFVEVYGLSARRVMLAGFDAFYIHALGGYLISQFLSPRFNTRTDEYGGDENKRMRFLLEIVEACRKNTAPSYPLVVRMSIDEFFPGGRGVEESIRIAKKLEEAGVSAIDAGAGVYESMHMIIPPLYLPKGCLTDLAAAVKREVRIPVITQGRLYDPELAESVLRDGKADFVALTRGMLADPYWVTKVASGRASEIRRCIGCNQCIGRIMKGRTIRCAINPTAGRESEFGEFPPKAAKARKVVIVGAGPGGMEAARVAAERGHSVTLLEKGSELGAGQLRMAAAAPCKDEFMNLARYYEHQFKRLENVKVVLDKEAGPDDIAREQPDAVILATGAVPLVPRIPGIDGKNVVTSHDVTSGKASPTGKVVIAGGGCAGAGIADMLSERELDVTVVEMLGDCAADEELITRLMLMGRLARKKVNILTKHTVREITADGVVVADAQGAVKTLPADTVVLAFGSLPNNPLEERLGGRAGSVQVVGDAGQVGKIIDAVVDGFLAAQKL